MRPWNVGWDAKPEGHATATDQMVETDDPGEQSSNERIDEAINELTGSLSEELLDLIMERDPSFFEKVVVDLLERMGYGKGEVTQYSHDGGIDGLVITDELGFRPVYTQAKRYAAEHKVGRPEVQAFIGALGGVQNGVFITTSSSTAEAYEAAERYPHATVVLIDGRCLTRLMIEYDLGVATERDVKVKRIDIAYFEE